MTRIALIAILFCAICGAAYGIIINRMKDTECSKIAKEMNTLTAVFANHDIAKGSKIVRTDLIEKDIERKSAPEDFVPSAGLAEGRHARVALKAGQIVLMHNLIVRPSGYIRIENGPSSP